MRLNDEPNSLLPKAGLTHLRSKLSADEFQRLKAAREGKHAPTEEEINRWSEMVK
jgi:hypothetical protein